MQTRSFDTPESLIAATVELLTETLATSRDTPFAIMLSGGSTPMPAYERIAQAPPIVSPNLRLLFSDERVVAPDSPESNYGNTRPMTDALGIPEDRVLRVQTELGLEDATKHFNDTLDNFFSKKGQIALGLLGMGADGHTASLFSLEDVARGAGRWAVPVPKTKGPDRVSVTADLLAKVERIVFLVSGNDKRATLDRLIAEPESLPAGAAVRNSPRVEIWTT